MTSSDYVSLAQIGALGYAALALAVLARWVRRLVIPALTSHTDVVRHVSLTA